MKPDITALVADLRARAKHRADMHNVQPHRSSILVAEELPEWVAAHLIERSAPLTLTADKLAVFKHAFYTNAGDETDDPFEKAFEALGFRLAAEPPTGIARKADVVKVDFIADCLRTYARILRDGKIDGAGHYFPIDIEEAADLLEAGEQPAPLTKTDLAEALSCFWNAAIGDAHNRQDSTAFAVIGAMAEGIAAVERRLRELDTQFVEGGR